MKLTLAKVLAKKYQQVSCFVFSSLPAMSVDNLCKQFGSRSGPIKYQARSGSKLFDTPMKLKNSSIQRVKYGTIIKFERIIKAIHVYSKIQKVIKIHFSQIKHVIFEPPRLYF